MDLMRLKDVDQGEPISLSDHITSPKFEGLFIV